MTRATMSTPKGGLSQAEVWEKVSALQTGLKDFSILFASLHSALRSTSPSTVMGPEIVNSAAIEQDCENSSPLYECIFKNLDAQTSLRNVAKNMIAQFTSQCVLSEMHRIAANMDASIPGMTDFASIPLAMEAGYKTLGTLSSHLFTLQEHREFELKSKEFTAVGYTEKENSTVRDRFEKAEESNGIHLLAVDEGKALKK